MTIIDNIHFYSEGISKKVTKKYAEQIPIKYRDLTTKQKIVIEMLAISSMKTSDFSELFNITMSASSQIISKLVSDKFVLRKENPNNRREMLLYLDSEGLEYVEVTNKIVRSLLKEQFEVLTQSELEQLEKIYKKMYIGMVEN